MWSVFQVCPITLTTMAFTGKLYAGITADLDPPWSKSSSGYGPPFADLDPLPDFPFKYHLYHIW